MRMICSLFGQSCVLLALLATPALAQPIPIPTPAPPQKVGTVPPPPSSIPSTRPSGPLPLAPVTNTRPSVTIPRPGETTAFDGNQRALVERVNVYLMSIQTLIGDFVQVGPDGARTEGKFYLQKPGRIRFEYN